MGGIAAPLVSPAGTNDVFRAGPRTYTRANRPRFLDPFGYLSGGYAGGYYSGPGYPTPESAGRSDAPAEYGFLRLNVQPYSAEVYVDGYYVSTVGDFSGTGPARALEAGPHRIEIRADGYETATFDVRIDPSQVVSYRRELARAEEPRQTRTVAPAIPKTFYVIPKCYAGDRRPSADRLPAGCRAANVRAIPPVVNRAK
jgi:PEGA domain